MKKLILPFTVLLMLSACQNEQKQFCTDATAALCDRCQSCGDFKACGLNRANSKQECVDALMGVCASYDSYYSSEIARTCLHGLNTLTCEQLRADGKPEVCTRLF